MCLHLKQEITHNVFYTNKALKGLNFSTCLLFVWKNSYSAAPLECHSSLVCLFTVCVVFSSPINYELVLHSLRERMRGCQTMWKVSFAGGLEAAVWSLELLKIANKKNLQFAITPLEKRGLPPNSRFPLRAIHYCFPLAVQPSKCLKPYFWKS